MCDSAIGFLAGHPRYARPCDPDHPPSQPLLAAPIVYETARPATWEYRVVSVDVREEAPLDDARLNALGTEGWMLVQIVALPAREHPVARLLYHFIRAL